MKLTFLKIPLYKLNYVSDIKEIHLGQEFLEQFRDEYELEERKSIFEQLKWALDNPNYQFKSLVDTDIFSNEEIYSYIKRLHKFILDNEAY